MSEKIVLNELFDQEDDNVIIFCSRKSILVLLDKTARPFLAGFSYDIGDKERDSLNELGYFELKKEEKTFLIVDKDRPEEFIKKHFSK